MNAPSVPQKLGPMTTNIFTAMNQVAAEQNAINLAQGFPNFECSAELIELVYKYMRDGYNQYPPMPGIPELREAIADKLWKLYDARYNPGTEITITPGGHSALMSAASAILQPGDEVILFEPAFDCFEPIVRLNGAVPVHVQLSPPRYQIPWEEVRRKITDNTSLLIINTPHNPSGTVLSREDIDSLIEITTKHDLFVLSDEVYEHIIFDDQEHLSVCRFPELAERSFAVFSFGKVYHTTGWKIGYCVAPAPLMDAFRSIHQMTTFCTNRPMQHAIAEFLRNPAHYLNLPAFFQRKRDFFLDRLQSSRFTITPAAGTYFQSMSYENIFEGGDMDAARFIAQEAGVASIPMSAFYHDNREFGVLRFCFAKTEETLEEAAEKLCKI